MAISSTGRATIYIVKREWINLSGHTTWWKRKDNVGPQQATIHGREGARCGEHGSPARASPFSNHSDLGRATLRALFQVYNVSINIYMFKYSPLAHLCTVKAYLYSVVLREKLVILSDLWSQQIYISPIQNRQICRRCRVDFARGHTDWKKKFYS